MFLDNAHMKAIGNEQLNLHWREKFVFCFHFLRLTACGKGRQRKQGQGGSSAFSRSHGSAEAVIKIGTMSYQEGRRRIHTCAVHGATHDDDISAVHGCFPKMQMCGGTSPSTGSATKASRPSQCQLRPGFG
jgi:hypothetical protein